MAPVNNNLKRAFIVVDVIIGILGTFWLIMSVFSHGVFHGDPESDTFLGIQRFSVMYVIGISIISLSAVALYGILKKKQWPLILFSVAMSVVSVLFLVVGIPSAILTHRTEEFVSFLINEAKNNMTEDIRQNIEFIQTTFRCCGFDNGVSDWGHDIPLSCQCPSSPEPHIQCIPVTVDEHEVQMYGQPCYQFLVDFCRNVYSVTTGVTFLYLTSVIVGIALSAAVVTQMRKKTITPPVTFTTCSSNSKYEELEA